MKTYLLLIALIGCGLSFPLQDDQNPSIHEGDMILTKEQVNDLYNPSKLRNGMRKLLKMWPKGLVYYKFSSSICKLNH